jgi:hypothetical protein
MPSKRELIDTGTDKRYVRRNKQGQFKGSDDVGLSVSSDRRVKAKAESKAGQGRSRRSQEASKEMSSALGYRAQTRT